MNSPLNQFRTILALSATVLCLSGCLTTTISVKEAALRAGETLEPGCCEVFVEGIVGRYANFFRGSLDLKWYGPDETGNYIKEALKKSGWEFDPNGPAKMLMREAYAGEFGPGILRSQQYISDREPSKIAAAAGVGVAMLLGGKVGGPQTALESGRGQQGSGRLAAVPEEKVTGNGQRMPVKIVVLEGRSGALKSDGVQVVAVSYARGVPESTLRRLAAQALLAKMN